ncbi:hypothetical protein EK21DRAFT_119592 [Setomelanomma holmii]|uniref:BZIP domain-containing protein n=1 Tax=Setomelanomma holmii TaxID=210430 RepID=A0A9P4GW75_9PLEO|nr:hypothetical protein EK21DRAFT_119592 [Setomelanomma holmii]
MATSEKRKLQNRLAQQKHRQKLKALGRDSGRAERTRRAASKRSVSSDLTVRPEQVYVQEQPSTRNGAINRLSTWLDTSEPLHGPSNLPIRPSSGSGPVQTYDSSPFGQTSLFKPKFKFPPNEDLLLAKFQYDVTAKLLQWMIPVANQPPIQSEFLHDLLRLWHQKELIFRQELAEQYDILYSVLDAWIKERLTVATLSARVTPQSDLLSPITSTIEQLHASNALRAEKLVLLQICADEKVRDELLAKAFSLLTDTEGLGTVFVYGIRRLQQEDLVMLGITGS